MASAAPDEEELFRKACEESCLMSSWESSRAAAAREEEEEMQRVMALSLDAQKRQEAQDADLFKALEVSQQAQTPAAVDGLGTSRHEFASMLGAYQRSTRRLKGGSGLGGSPATCWRKDEFTPETSQESGQEVGDVVGGQVPPAALSGAPAASERIAQPTAETQVPVIPPEDRESKARELLSSSTLQAQPVADLAGGGSPEVLAQGGWTPASVRACAPVDHPSPAASVRASAPVGCPGPEGPKGVGSSRGDAVVDDEPEWLDAQDAAWGMVDPHAYEHLPAEVESVADEAGWTLVR